MRYGRTRWIICALLFFATTVNYIDRQVLGILKPVLERQFHWSEQDYGWIVSAFQLAYALMMPLAGRLVDRIGVRLGYSLAVILWSCASIAHAWAGSLGQFMAVRFGLGIGESANFPAAIKAVAAWFPARERAFATGLLNSGSNVGALVAPLLVPPVAAALGWRAVFFVTAGLDMIWLAAWLAYYRSPSQHSAVSSTELAYITEPDAPAPNPVRTRFSSLLSRRQTWAFVLGKLLTDPVWWFYLFWIPGFLNKAYGLDIGSLGLPLVVVYLAADAGSVLGGWLPSRFVALGWSVNRSRKTAMLLCACCAVPVMSLIRVHAFWPAVAMIGLAAAAHQGWSANLFTTVSDTFPASAVGAVVGLGGMAGTLGGMAASPLIGRWLDVSGGAYRPLFFIGGSAYLIALALIQILVPKLEAAQGF